MQRGRGHRESFATAAVHAAQHGHGHRAIFKRIVCVYIYIYIYIHTHKYTLYMYMIHMHAVTRGTVQQLTAASCLEGIEKERDLERGAGCTRDSSRFAFKFVVGFQA